MMDRWIDWLIDWFLYCPPIYYHTFVRLKQRIDLIFSRNRASLCSSVWETIQFPSIYNDQRQKSICSGSNRLDETVQAIQAGSGAGQPSRRQGRADGQPPRDLVNPNIVQDAPQVARSAAINNTRSSWLLCSLLSVPEFNCCAMSSERCASFGHLLLATCFWRLCSWYCENIFQISSLCPAKMLKTK